MIAYIVTTADVRPEQSDICRASADIVTVMENMVNLGLTPEGTTLWGSDIDGAAGWSPVAWTEVHKAEFASIAKRMGVEA